MPTGVIIDKDDPRVVNATYMGHLLGVSARRIQQMAKEGMPKRSNGRYYAPECIQWWHTQALGGAERQANLEEQRRELLFEQTIKERTNNEINRQHLIPASLVQTVFNTAATMLASQLDALGRRLGAVCEGLSAREIESIVFDECREIRRAYGRQLSSLEADITISEPDSDPPAQKNSGRVGGRRKNPATRKPRAREMAE